jgi:hypothetical protein
MKKFFLDLVTDHDNDGEIVSILGTLAMLVFLGMTVYVGSTNHTFEYVNFGTGAGLILAGLGGGYWSKSKAKPTV